MVSLSRKLGETLWKGTLGSGMVGMDRDLVREVL